LISFVNNILVLAAGDVQKMRKGKVIMVEITG
jgi:hypothetical protein